MLGEFTFWINISLAGYLGSLAAALFMSYALQRKPPREWGAGLMSTLEPALSYIKKIGRDVQESEQGWPYFFNAWKAYLTTRGIQTGDSDPMFPADYSVEVRDQFYKSVSYSGWGGASGHDAPMIAYDALLGAGESWEELCSRAMFHGGDSDSTGVIAAAWWGAIYGMDSVPPGNYKKLEYKSRLEKLAEQLFEKAQWTQCKIRRFTTNNTLVPQVERKNTPISFSLRQREWQRTNTRNVSSFLGRSVALIGVSGQLSAVKWTFQV